ncbi:Peptidase S1/S6 [Cordyceps militaris CM01]|uniref:Peptidase S1/S6 n=1 Tax=Cordyceps militaris (strain CM01) TaxID=983644 RepID=G3JPF4_CORMM|nr:Peptidase S1/S6 [Cordyceps militaris CM01]EGX89764.1 Peptidase S1/S6 [Cordyceps militaris CM01]
MAPNKAFAAAVAIFTVQTAVAQPIDFEAKVIGGSQANQSEWPWIVSLRGAGDQHTCGGSLIAPDTVVTAAHCSGGQPASQFSVLAGSNDRTSSQATVVGVASIKNHRGFNEETLVNDISIWKLSTPIKAGPTIKFVQLPEQGQDPAASTAAKLAGWGVTKDPNQPQGGQGGQGIPPQGGPPQGGFPPGIFPRDAPQEPSPKLFLPQNFDLSVRDPQGPTGQNPGFPVGQDPGFPNGQNPGSPVGQDPSSPVGQDPGSPVGQNPGSPVGQDPGSQPPQGTPDPEAESTTPPQLLRETALTVLDRNDCSQAYQAAGPRAPSITQDMICAGVPGGAKDSCFGDSGGPLVDASSKTLVGIVSFGLACGHPTAPGVYTKVSSFLDFIKNPSV